MSGVSSGAIFHELSYQSINLHEPVMQIHVKVDRGTSIINTCDANIRLIEVDMRVIEVDRIRVVGCVHVDR